MLRRLNYDGSSILFIMHTCDESEAQINQALSSIRRNYFTAPILVISEGRAPTEAVGINRAMLLPSRNFKKGLYNGSRWWQRFFETACLFESAWVIKIDPDTMMRSPIELWENDSDFLVMGTLQREGEDDQHIQGGCQIFSRASVYPLLEESRSRDYENPNYWKTGQAEEFISRDIISTDYILAKMMRNRHVEFIDHPEIECHALPQSAFSDKAAVTHPHKLT